MQLWLSAIVPGRGLALPHQMGSHGTVIAVPSRVFASAPPIGTHGTVLLTQVGALPPHTLVGPLGTAFSNLSITGANSFYQKSALGNF